MLIEQYYSRHKQKIMEQKKGEILNSPVTILHINHEYEVSYWIIRENTKIVSSIPLFQAIDLLKTTEFDLILSEPQNLAIITARTFQ
jgi:hypothetical protein